MVIGAAIGIAAAIGGQRYRDIAECLGTETVGAVLQVFVFAGIAPGGFGSRHGAIVSEREGGRSFGDAIQKRPRRFGNVGDGIAGYGKGMQHGQHALRHVQSNSITGAARRARIIRHQDDDLSIGPGCLFHRQEGSYSVGNLRNAVRFRLVRQVCGIFSSLEGDRAGEDAAVELRQHHVHGKVGGVEATPSFRPALAPRRGDNDLENGQAAAVENGFAVVIGAAGEGRGGEDGGRGEIGNRPFYECDRFGILQAADEDRQRCKTARHQRLEQGVDRCCVIGKQHGAVEEDRQARRIGCETGQKHFRWDDALARAVKAGFRHDGCRRQRVVVAPRQHGQPARQKPHIVRPAFAKATEQGGNRVFRNRRGCGKPFVAHAAFAGQHGEGDIVFPCQPRDFVGAIGPAVITAENADKDDLGMRRGLFQPEVDRHRVAQVGQVGEGERRGVCACHTPLCPAGHLPHMGGDRRVARARPSRGLGLG